MNWFLYDIGLRHERVKTDLLAVDVLYLENRFCYFFVGLFVFSLVNHFIFASWFLLAFYKFVPT